MDLKLSDAEGMVKKEKGMSGGIQGKVKEKINSIPEGKSLALVTLVNWMLSEGLVKDRRQAYVRVSNAMESLADTFVRALDPKDRYTYIIRRSDIEKAEGKEQTPEKEQLPENKQE